MTVSHRLAAASASLCVALLAVGCGQSSSPTAPTSLGLGASQVSAGGATITGTVNGDSALTASINTANNNPALTATTGGATSSQGIPVTVSVVGTDISTTIDGRGRFTLTGVPTGDVQLRFVGTGIDATITLMEVREGDTIEVVVRASAGRIRIEAIRRHARPDLIEFEGTISAIDATARTLTVGGRVIEVPDRAFIRRGDRLLTFADLRVGHQVQVHATMEGTRIVAAIIRIKNDDDDDDDRDDGESEVEGVVSGLSGTCPAISFTLAGVAVTTSAVTQFEEGCFRVVNGARVEAKGLRTNGSLQATRVKLDD